MRDITIFPDIYSGTRIIGIQYSSSDAGWFYPNHTHPYFEFLLCINGEIRRWINGNEFVLQAGDAIVIPSNAPHHIHTPESAVLFDFHFDVEQKDLHAIFQMAACSFIPASAHLEDKVTVRQMADELIRLYRDLSVSHTDSEPALAKGMLEAVGALYVQSQSTRFSSRLAHHLLTEPGNLDLSRESSIPPSTVKVAQEVAHQLESNIQKGIQIGEIAKRLSINRSYLTQCFKRVYGMSPIDYYTRIRIREAKRLLRESEESIERIAEQLAFSSAGHFSSFFRSNTGLSPMQFRNHLLQHGHVVTPVGRTAVGIQPDITGVYRIE